MAMRGFTVALALTLLPLAAAAGEFRTLNGHGGPVMDITVAPDGRIATASFDNSVGLWTGDTPAWRDGHEAAVNSVIFLPDGALASAGDDFQIRLWEGESSRILGAHQGKITELALAPHGRYLASASWDGTVGLWPLDGGAPRFLTGHDAGVNAVAFSGDGTVLYSAGADGTIRIWHLDPAASAQDRVLLSHGFGINTLTLGPGDAWLAFGTVDGATLVTDPASTSQIADFTLERRPILAMARSPDGARLAVGDGEGFIMVIATADWSIEKDFRATSRGPVWALDFSGDGADILASGLEPLVYSWPLDTMEPYRPMADSEPSFLQDPDTMENGERQFARKCSICHTLTPGTGRRAGPSLHGLFGRVAGTLADYTYSDALDGSGIVWTPETIDALFEEGPAHYVPGTKMPMQRITGPDDRADLIDYLRRATVSQE